MFRRAFCCATLTVAIQAAAAASALGATSTPTSHPCRDGIVPASMRTAADTPRPSDLKTLADGTALRTTYLPNAAYSVTKCHPSGALERQVTYERRATPTGTAYLVTRTVTPDGDGITVATPEWPAATDEQWAKGWASDLKAMEADRDRPNTPSRLTAFEGLPDRAQAATARTAAARKSPFTKRTGPINYQCSNSHYNLIADPATFMRTSAWPNHGYPIYTALPSASFRNAVLNGYAAWDATWNACGFADSSPTQSWWVGDVGGWSNTADGANYIGGWSNRGFLCGSVTGALACTWGHGAWLSTGGPGGQNFRLTDSDTFYDMSYCWTIGSIPGCYDIQSVSAHEAGHAYGLMHVGCCGDDYENDLVMFPDTYDNDTTHRTLALGDIWGITQFYPY